MLNSIETILSEISKAEIKLGKKTGQIPVNLFETTEIVDLTFNGCTTLKDYDHFCEALLRDLQDQIDSITSDSANALGAVRSLNLLLFDAKSQDERYFPKKKKEDWLVKVTFKIRYQAEFTHDQLVRDTVLRFLEIQKRLITRCIRLIRHRIKHIHTFFPIQDVHSHHPGHAPFIGLPPYQMGQLSLFPNGMGQTTLTWNRSKADLLELIVALSKSNSVGSTGGVLHQKDLIELFGWFFNIDLGSARQAIGALKRRKKPESSYTRVLTEVFKQYCEGEQEKKVLDLY